MRISREQQMRAAEEMFKLLDPKDGKTNQKIDASIWNKFVKEVVGDGKEIKTSIDKEHALRSIRTYLARQNADENTLKKWNEGIKGMEIEKRTDVKLPDVKFVVGDSKKLNKAKPVFNNKLWYPDKDKNKGDLIKPMPMPWYPDKDKNKGDLTKPMPWYPDNNKN